MINLSKQITDSIVTITHGRLTGLKCYMDDATPVIKNERKIRLIAEGDGPSFVITVKLTKEGLIGKEVLQELVRTELTKRIGLYVSWSKEKGYTTRTETPSSVAWSKSIGRFVPVPKEPDVVIEKDENEEVSD